MDLKLTVLMALKVLLYTIVWSARTLTRWMESIHSHEYWVKIEGLFSYHEKLEHVIISTIQHRTTDFWEKSRTTVSTKHSAVSASLMCRLLDCWFISFADWITSSSSNFIFDLQINMVLHLQNSFWRDCHQKVVKMSSVNWMRAGT